MSTHLNLAKYRLERILYYRDKLERNIGRDQNAIFNLILECNAYLRERLQCSCHFIVTEYENGEEADVYFFDYYEQFFTELGQCIKCYHRTGKFLYGFFNCSDLTFKWEVVGE